MPKLLDCLTVRTSRYIHDYLANTTNMRINVTYPPCMGHIGAAHPIGGAPPSCESAVEYAANRFTRAWILT